MGLESGITLRLAARQRIDENDLTYLIDGFNRD